MLTSNSAVRLRWPETQEGAPCRALIKREPEDFVVDEMLAFEPNGTGDHLYLWLEKRGVAALELVRRLAETLGVAAEDIGLAGLKDTHAITRQWVSTPYTLEVERRVHDQTLWDDALRIHRAVRHPHKLRTGLLRGNHFNVRLRELQGVGAKATLERRWAQLERLGLLNAFGTQRFGRDDNTLKLGLELLENPKRHVKRQLRRLALSAVQAALFNRWLAQRVADGIVHQVLLGDVMQVVASGGPFWADDVAEVQGRLSSRSVVVSGPIFGPKMRQARGDAMAREMAVVDDAGLRLEAFAGQGKLCLGTRRAAVVWPKLEQLIWEDKTTCVASFFLPAGSYATELVLALVDEVVSARRVTGPPS